LKKIFLIFFILFFNNTIYSQNEKTLINEIINYTEDYILKKNYKEADSLLKEFILNSDLVSSEITFLFGKNSFFIKKYKQSINWLNKYIEMKGVNGKNSEEAIKFLELSNTKNVLEKEKNIENVFAELFSYRYIECPNNKKVCPVCKGSSVMIRETEISKVYKTCPFSDNKGYLTCDEYNLFLRGELKPKTTIFSKSN
jgi:hypothetical protein|tara:strand:- start:36528 stop:37121 length:594 start_codon:yes stop_codon:yes gene_type:complete